MDKSTINEAFSHMTQEEIIAALPHIFDELLNMVPIEERAKVNVVISKLKKAVAEQDNAAILEIQRQYKAFKNPMEPEKQGLFDAIMNLFKFRK